MRILTRYILREIVSHALLGGVLFTFILYMRDLGRILALVVHNSSSLVSVLKIFLFILPNTLVVTIPMSVLVGILLGLSRLAADSEITAMRASGIGVLNFVRIAAVVAVAGWGAGLANSLYFAPRAAAALLQLENSLATSQASYEIQPRVFYEDFKDYVLYVQEVKAGTGVANWRNIFSFRPTRSDPGSLRIISAGQATVVNDQDSVLRMRLRDGVEHQTDAAQPNQYTISTFVATDLPLPLSDKDEAHLGRSDAPILAVPSSELLVRSRGSAAKTPDAKAALIELNKRLSYPAACLVLMLVGVPLGMATRRGGKSAGFVLTILLVFVYYFLSIIGLALARQGKVPPFAGVWLANVVFGIGGIVLLRQMATGSTALAFLGAAAGWMKGRLPKLEAPCVAGQGHRAGPAACAGKVSAHSGRLHPARIPDHPRPRSGHLRHAVARLHLLRTDRRYHPQQDAVHHGRRLPDQSHPEHDLHHHSIECAARRSGHLWDPATQQRAHCNESYRHQPLPSRASGAGNCVDRGSLTLRL